MTVVNVTERIDAAPIGGFQRRVVVLCALVALIDGIDIQTLAISIPRLSVDWGLPPSSFGVVLSATFAGILVGTMLVAPLGDRFGRRRVILPAFLLLAVASLASAFSGSIAMLAACRLVTGVAIGACLPNVTALTSEYVPAKRAGIAVSLMYAAVPLGGVLGSMIGGSLIDLVDWRAIFLIGGLLPLSLWVVIFLWLPESIHHHLAQGGRNARIGVLLQRIDPRFIPTEAQRFTIESQSRHGTVRDLFRSSRTTATIWLWATFFLNMAATYLLVSWLPVIFTASGWSQGNAIRTLGFFQIGGIVGGLLGGWLADRIGPHVVLMAAYALGVVSLVFAGVFPSSPAVVSLLLGIAGSGILGAQLVLTVISAMLYPVTIRSTSVGWALGIGRCGAVLSPLAGGLAIDAGLGGSDLLFCVAGLGLMSIGAAAGLRQGVDRLAIRQAPILDKGRQQR